MTEALGVRPTLGVAAAPHAAPPVQATLALAAKEGRRLVRHPAFLASVAVSAVFFVSRAGAANDTYLGLTTVGAFVPGLGTLIAANLAALRARVDRSAELLGTAPLGAPDRTRGLLLGLAFPVAATIVFLAAVAVWHQIWDGVPVATTAGIEHLRPSVVEVLQGPLFVAFAGALGVLLARWVPTRLASVLVAAGIFFPFAPLLFWGVQAKGRYLAPLVDHRHVVGWADLPDGSGYNIVSGFEVAAAGWHALYLAGLTGLVAIVALARHGFTRRLRVALLPVLVVTAGAAVLQLG